MSADLKKQKIEVRQRILALRDALLPEYRAVSTKAIMFALQQLSAYCQAKVVLAYMSIGSEIDTRTFVTQILADGKMLVLPRVDLLEHRLVLHQVTDLDQCVAGKWKIPEPRQDLPVQTLDKIDFSLLPGVAFDRQLNRLGYGGGYYDRLFGRAVRSCRVAAAFSCQLIDRVPVSANDVPVDILVTESEIIERKT